MDNWDLKEKIMCFLSVYKTNFRGHLEEQVLKQIF